jgi:5-methylcytosine-specific restriction protein B
MNTFIFQSVVKDKFDLRKDIEKGGKGTWYATRYLNEMSPGDRVFFWLGGDENIRGLYGWGILISNSYEKPGWDAPGVDFEYKGKFNQPILAKKLKTDPVLRDLLILKAPQASNFLLKPDEAKRLVNLIKDSGEYLPDIGG